MYKESPIHYFGNKYKLLSQIFNYFPKEINGFYDLFGGSGVVSLNVKANKYYLNDLDKTIYDFYNLFKDDNILFKMKDIIYKYNFINLNNKENENKIPFDNLKNSVNKNKDVLELYVLSVFSFCYAFRFNSKGEFNSSVGNRCLSDDKIKAIKYMQDFITKQNVKLSNKSYLDFIDFEENDFVYLDPPYSQTGANYNKFWTIDDDYKLFDYLKMLNEKGIKFGMSNVFYHKHKNNEHLDELCKKNNFIVHHLRMNYINSNNKNDFTDEVLICNYGEEDKELFDL